MREGDSVDHPIGPADEVRRDGCRTIDVNGRQVLVVWSGEAFYAVFDRCPHMPASLSQGTISGTFTPSAPQQLDYGRHERVIRCPWHGWEFDLETGRSLLEPQRTGLKTYPVTVEDGVVVLHS
jgi:3-phenylpropionate/trans-cinnamate dioxygenase ferredoxin subunit